MQVKEIIDGTTLSSGMI